MRKPKKSGFKINPEIIEQRKRNKFFLKYIEPWSELFHEMLITRFSISESGELLKEGRIVGSNSNGYLVVGISKKVYLVHRIIYFMVNKFLPEVVDHINHNTKDNRPENLRAATIGLNGCNRKRKTDIPLGVYQITRKGREGIWWSAYIEKNGKRYSSTFREKERAVKWRLNKEKELFGEFQNEENKRMVER